MYRYYGNKINKELVISKKDNQNFKNFAKCWICDHVSIEGDVKLKIISI